MGRLPLWPMTVLGCCLLLSLELSYTSVVKLLEQEFYQQLLALSPFTPQPVFDRQRTMPLVLENGFILGAFALLGMHLIFTRRTEPNIYFVILLCFSLIMLQVLPSVMSHFWLPTAWSVISVILTATLLTAMTRVQKISKYRLTSRRQKLQAIKQKIQQKDYQEALDLLKRCRFTDTLFDLAYELGMKLEQQENWRMAKQVYQWLVQFDPGIEDFVKRIDNKLDPGGSATETKPAEHTAQIGHYQLLGKKAAGATASVYEAFDLNTHKRIAMKIYNRVITAETDQREVNRFLDEARTVSRLDHPNIVKIHDADIINEHAYIAMDYIAGYSMAEWLRRNELLSVSESLRIMKSMLEALMLAHQKNIVHGDIKPANIMYDRHRDCYILTDFGAAYGATRPGGQLDTEKKIVGTPAYMSPEQLSGARMDGRSDLFSLAVTIYQLLSGKQPFQGKRLPELKSNIINQPVELNALRVPDMIRQVLDKALQKKTYKRFADASQMLQAIKSCERRLQDEVSSTQPEL